MHPTRRQKAVLDAIQDHLAETGEPPTLLEIARRCGLSSVATVHRHLALLQERGLLKRRRSRRRGIELKAAARRTQAAALPILGSIAAGRPIEAIADADPAVVPLEMVRRPADSFVLRVRGDSMRDEQILDGDLLVVERRERFEDGDVVVAVASGRDAALRTFRREEAASLEVQGVVVGLFRRFDAP